jgi:hypothetical protein
MQPEKSVIFTFEEGFGRVDGKASLRGGLMLKIEADIFGTYRAEIIVSPISPTLVYLKDRKFEKLFFCVGSSARPHASSNLFEEYGQFGSFDLPTMHVVRCDQCSLVYHVPREKVEVITSSLS